MRPSTRARWRGTSSPSTVTRPALAASSPRMMAIVVVLPAPLAPSSAVVEPVGTSKLTRSTATTSP